MVSNSPATSSSCGRSSAAGAGAGVASTTASASTTPPGGREGHPRKTTAPRSAGDERRRSAPRPRGPRPTRRRATPCLPQRPEERRPVGVGRGHLGAQGRISPPRRWAAAKRAGTWRRRTCRRRSRHGSRRSAVDQHVDDERTELARHERANGAVADRPTRLSGSGRTASDQRGRVHRGRRGCPSGPSARTGWGCRGRGLRAACAGGRGPIPTHPGPRWARVSSPIPTSRHRSTASGRRPRNPSGPRSTARPPMSALCSGPPSCGDASRRVTAGAPAAGSAPPVSSQAAASPLMPPPTTTTRRAATSGRPRRRRRSDRPARR